MSGNRGKSSFETMDTIDTGVSPEKSNLSKVDIKRGAKDISVDLDPISKINKGFTDCDDSLIIEKGVKDALKIGAGVVGGGIAGGAIGHSTGKKKGRKEGLNTGYPIGAVHGYTRGLIDAGEHPEAAQRVTDAKRMRDMGPKLPNIATYRYEERPKSEAKSLDDSLVVEKGVRENLSKIMDAGSRVSERAMQNRHIYPDKAERYDKAAKKLFGKFDELKATREVKEIDDSLVVEKGFLTNAFKRIVKPFRNEANVVPNDLKTGLDRVSRANRVNTTLARNGSGPAKNTIMAQRQAAGKHLTGLRPQAKIARGSTIPQEPNAIDFNKRIKELDESVIVEKGIKDSAIRAGKYLKREIEGEHKPVTYGMGLATGFGVGGLAGHHVGKKESDKKSKPVKDEE